MVAKKSKKKISFLRRKKTIKVRSYVRSGGKVKGYTRSGCKVRAYTRSRRR